VRVERGAVEVREEGRALVATLKPGQAWESRALDDDARNDRDTEALPGSGPSSPPASARAAPPLPPLPPLPTSSNPAPTRGAELSPRALFERADAARLAGRHADAAAEFERFCRRFPGDPRAGLAAYELGRIRLGSLGDPRGAVEAFTIVLARDEGDPFREDAEAGRVEALDDLGDPAACKRARDAFRARYPSSPHAGRLARLCGAP
jgi:TolA-binding protein